MGTIFLFSCFVFLTTTKYTISSATQADIFSPYVRLRHTKTCSQEDLHPIFKIKWNDYRIKVHQVTKPEVTSENKYFLQSNFRSNGVACLSTPNISSFNFSFTGNLFNQPVEFYFYHLSGSSKLLFQNVKTVEKLSFQCDRITITNNQTVDNISFLNWNYRFEYKISSKTKAINGTLSTNCNPFKETSESVCMFETVLDPQGLQISLLADGKFQRSLEGGILSARLIRRASHQQLDPLFFNANWSTSFGTFLFSAEIIYGTQSLLLFKMNSSSFNSELNLELVSLAYDWRWFSNSVIQPTHDGRKIMVFSEGNNLIQQNAIPIKYIFGLVESNSSSRVFDLRHNVSSALYSFEGNMTVDVKSSDSEPQIVTEITQKVRTSFLKRAIRLDLRQIFHNSGHWNWETVVLKSRLFDMHVSGHWNHTILHLYRKRFQIHSHDEEYLPSLNFEINYSDSVNFHHLITFPFLAFSYSLLIDFTNTSSCVPVRIQILFRDEFLTNYSRSILQLNLFEVNGVLNANASVTLFEITHIIKGIGKQIEKLTNWIGDDQHPINQLVQPFIRRSTLARGFDDVFTRLKTFLLLKI